MGLFYTSMIKKIKIDFLNQSDLSLIEFCLKNKENYCKEFYGQKNHPMYYLNVEKILLDEKIEVPNFIKNKVEKIHGGELGLDGTISLLEKNQLKK